MQIELYLPLLSYNFLKLAYIEAIESSFLWFIDTINQTLEEHHRNR